MIKFRAWDKVQKVMMVPRDIQTDSDGNIFYVEAMGPDGEYDEGDLDVFKLEQFTGLTDVNGKDIYEGDVLEYCYETHGQTFYDPDTLGAVVGEPGIETNVIGKVAIWPSTGVVLTRIKAEHPEDFEICPRFKIKGKTKRRRVYTPDFTIYEGNELIEAMCWNINAISQKCDCIIYNNILGNKKSQRLHASSLYS